MNREHTPLELKSASWMMVSRKGVYFFYGPQSFLGTFFLMITGISYITSIFLMGTVLDSILVDISGNYQFFGYVASAAFGVALCFMVSISTFLLTVILFLSVGGYLLYMSTEESLLIYALSLIIVGHIGNYVFQVVKGDKLTIKLSSNTYKINYRHKVLDEGEFSQNDIEIRVSDAAEAGYRYDAVFLPATKRPMGCASSLPRILSVQGCSENIFQEIVGDLEKLFNHLGISYEKNLWVLKK